MSDPIRTEQLRTEQAKLQLQSKHEREVKDLKEKQRAEVERVIDNHAVIKADLEKAYEVALSTSADEHQRRMSEIRDSNSKMAEEEKLKGEQEVENIRSRYHEQITRYKANAEKQLEDLRRQTEHSADNIRRTHERAKT